jgi:hypothetical protein
MESKNEMESCIAEEGKKSYRTAWKKVPMVSQLFKLLSDPKPIEETPLWYMHWIGISTSFYQPMKVLIGAFRQSHSSTAENCVCSSLTISTAELYSNG